MLKCTKQFTSSYQMEKKELFKEGFHLLPISPHDKISSFSQEKIKQVDIFV